MATRRIERRMGFTLIELLVVVAIIVLLIAILLPALAAARKQGYVVQTRALLTGLQTNIEMYATTFQNQYPGPVRESEVASGVGGGKITGTQNLLLGLSCAMTSSSGAWSTASTPPGPAGTLIPATGVTAMYTMGDLTQTLPTTPALAPNQKYANSPIDYSNSLGTGTVGSNSNVPLFKQWPAFYNPTNKELSPPAPPMTWPRSGVNNGLDDTPSVSTGQLGSMVPMRFPTILDRFPDALPILYYRRNVGVDTPVVVSNGGAVGSPPAGAYYLDANYEYTNSGALHSPLTGLTFSQGLLGNVSPLNSVTAPNTPTTANAALAGLINPSGNAVATGGYALVAAGASRVYGKATETIVVVGGQ